MKQILILCPHPPNTVPGQRLKYEQYFEIFRSEGYAITVSSFYDIHALSAIYKHGNYWRKILAVLRGYIVRIGDLFRLRRFDIVYIFLWCVPFIPNIFELIVLKVARRTIYDLDDMIHLNPKSRFSPFVHLLRSASKTVLLISKADDVITCTPFLQNFCRKYNKNVTDIPSTVDTVNRYKPKQNYRTDCCLTIGWSGSFSTSKYYYILANVFLELKKTHNFNLVAIGDSTIEIPGLTITALDWNESIEVQTLESFDIGVYPLPDEQWVYGKSGLKAIQYMALGIPTVATAIAANFRVIKHGKSGFLVRSEAEWLDTLKVLLTDGELRKKVGEGGRARVERLFSVHSNAEKYLKVLRGEPSYH